ncbi:Uu.00g068770.m01.CDS01 [Anthostomella pinea]|uniref:Uu.00g068770.m01.CDS01 n=1 Tax=Anthostomella pinea TaxID=933095 RepID=A0AAI8YL38_9PEZI|nr:Uu.00g068770.m01.CDS01 [Anthostomella pinea]
MLDVSVAGGIKAGTSPLDTIIAEAGEEASLPPSLVRKNILSAGVLTYVSATGAEFPGEQGLVVPDLIYAYDMELPADVIPKPHDDEVKGFALMSVPEVQRALLGREFKPDAAAVLVDFLVRHGVITAENEPRLAEITMHLHRRLPFRTAPP